MSRNCWKHLQLRQLSPNLCPRVHANDSVGTFSSKAQQARPVVGTTTTQTLISSAFIFSRFKATWPVVRNRLVTMLPLSCVTSCERCGQSKRMASQLLTSCTVDCVQACAPKISLPRLSANLTIVSASGDFFLHSTAATDTHQNS